MRATVGAALCAGLLLASAASAASAEEVGAWRRLTRDAAFEVAVDTASFTGPPTRRAARTVIVSLAEETPRPFLVVETEIDCEARTISAARMSLHDSAGAVMREGDLPAETETVDEADGTAELARAACGESVLDGEAFPSAAAFAAWTATLLTEP